eukprot:9159249-Pyramimonas_sp.AAC.1
MLRRLKSCKGSGCGHPGLWRLLSKPRTSLDKENKGSRGWGRNGKNGARQDRIIQGGAGQDSRTEQDSTGREGMSD